MSLFHVDPRESRAPETEVLPDGRKRLTRFFEVATKLTVPAELNFAPGTADPFSSAPAGWTGLLSTYLKMTDELAPKGKDSRPILQITFEQIGATGETLVGGATERVLEDGRVGYELNYLQFSRNAFVSGTVGTSTAPNDASAFLLSVEAPDDGTLRQIKRTYVYAGQLAIDTQTSKNGALSIIKITSAKTVPTTPGGYTLFDQPIQAPNGLPIYTYSYAKGNGEESRQIEYRQSADMGTNGVTITTIRYLTASSVNTDPTTGPASSVNIGVTHEDADGYRIWTSIYANGSGTILSTVETKNGGKLVIYRITSLNAVPTAPGATIGGTVTLISATRHLGSRFESGVVIYEYQWAEGQGQISVEVSYSQSSDLGAHGITRTVIRYLTASSVNTDPTTPPGGSVNVGFTWEDIDGHRIWTSTYAKGTGNVVTSSETKENGKLVIYRIVALGTAPTAPSATIGGVVVLVAAEQRTEGGFAVFDYRWAEGFGLIIDETTISETGALVVYHRVNLGAVPVTPTATIGGTVTLFESSTRNEDGYQLYDYRWAEGKNQSSIVTRGEPDGALVYTVVNNAAAAITPAYPGGGTGYLIELEQSQRSGYVSNRAVFKRPPASTGFPKTVEFDMPGTVGFNSPQQQLVFTPPVDRMRILATVTVSYLLAPDTTAPFRVRQYASFTDSYTITGNKNVVNHAQALTKYLGAGSSVSGTSSQYAGVQCDTWQATIIGSTPSGPPSGATVIINDNDPYLVDITGVVVYKNIKTTFTF